MRTRNEQVFDRIFLVRPGPLESLSTSLLRTVDTQWSPLDVTIVTDGDRHRLLGDQRVQVNIADFLAADFRTSLIPVLIPNCLQVSFDNIEDVRAVLEDGEIIGNFQQ